MRNFVGHSSLIENFKNRCSNGNLSHAQLISGEDGIGKSILAEILGKLILNGDLNREYVDIINYRPSKASFGVDDVREIIDEVNKKPFEGDKKVIIIHQGNKLTIQAQNALLKTIEEPPTEVYIIILCESLELILDTIKSRCEIYKLTPLTKDELYKYIAIKGYDYSEEEKASAIAFSEGIPGRIDRYFSDTELQELRDKIVDLLLQLTNNEIEAILEKEEQLVSYKQNKEEVINVLSSFIRDILVNKEVYNENLIINRDKIKEIERLTNEMSFKKLNKMILGLQEARKNIKNNVSWAMTVRIMLMDFMEG
ncbi:MAG: DNA polymerase III subunit delta' [Clostridium sp.]|jgi:DNA polymerase III subunit delta'|uniref:DNA polymerase III subunit delta' n=1 Tax=Clostridium sp. TaxID=1506 RepID=UPI002671AC18|nr:DNA polymerase III subunit delta' [Clostridium sp.]MCI7030160.1 DNA polymerase III subunit delta' [Clostridium sp.]MDD7682844.1 DNA polymerase III subunit delta' [Clostridium sp.]MDY2580793.1 DNA polymerase III subunit delta' [Clostridium sp.]